MPGSRAVRPAAAVLISAHNPDAGRLARVLDALMAQSLPAAAWELVVVDNGSSPALDAESLGLGRHANARLVREERLGLLYGRLAGLAATTADIVIFCDDDTVFAPDYVARAAALFRQDPRLGNAGGQSVPEFEVPPPPWAREFDLCLALREGHEQPVVEEGWTGRYPALSNGGGGAVFRREALGEFLRALTDSVGQVNLRGRTGTELTSGEDNHIVLEVMRAGWRVGYFPELVMRHLIPARRLTPSYLGRLNHGIAKSWVQVLALHGICPWAPAAPWTVPLRKLRAYVRHRAWAGPAEHVRWRGTCGHFEGRATIGSVGGGRAA